MPVLYMKEDRKWTILRSYYKYFLSQGIEVTRESMVDPNQHRDLFKKEFVSDMVTNRTMTEAEASETFDKNF